MKKRITMAIIIIIATGLSFSTAHADRARYHGVEGLIIGAGAVLVGASLICNLSGRHYHGNYPGIIHYGRYDHRWNAHKRYNNRHRYYNQNRHRYGHGKRYHENGYNNSISRKNNRFQGQRVYRERPSSGKTNRQKNRHRY